MRKTMPATVFLRGKFFAVYSLHMPFYWNWTENQTGVYRNKTIIMRGFIYFKLKIFSEKYNVTLPTFYRLTWTFPPCMGNATSLWNC